MDIAEDWISEPEDRSIENNQTEAQRETKKNRVGVRYQTESKNHAEHSQEDNTHVIGVLEIEQRMG